MEKDTDFKVFCDNQPVVTGFNKTRSKNDKIHGCIKRTVSLLAENNSRLQVVWIPTRQMAALADGPSRNVYERDNLGLSNHGWDYLQSLLPDLRHWFDVGGLVSCFGGPTNNAAGVPYFSQDTDLGDQLCRGRDFFEAVEERRGEEFRGGFLAFPPANQVVAFAREIRSQGLAEGSQVFLILPARMSREVLNLMLGVGQIQIHNFCSGQNRKMLKKRANCKMSVMVVTGWSQGPGPEKRQRR